MKYRESGMLFAARHGVQRYCGYSRRIDRQSRRTHEYLVLVACLLMCLYAMKYRAGSPHRHDQPRQRHADLPDQLPTDRRDEAARARLHRGDPTASRNCTCSPVIVTRYQKRISGPLLDAKRIDVPRVDYEKLASDRAGEASEAVRIRVLSARERQLVRFDGSDLTCNADTPALAAQVHAFPAALRRRRAGRVWVRRTFANTASWTTPARP